MKVHIITDLYGDWIALYKDGSKVAEGHSLDEKQVLDALGIEYTESEISNDEYDTGIHEDFFPKVLP